MLRFPSSIEIDPVSNLAANPGPQPSATNSKLSLFNQNIQQNTKNVNTGNRQDVNTQNNENTNKGSTGGKWTVTVKIVFPSPKLIKLHTKISANFQPRHHSPSTRRKKSSFLYLLPPPKSRSQIISRKDNLAQKKSGDVLISRVSQVLQALRSLTSVFGMGTGGSSSLLSPETIFLFYTQVFNNHIETHIYFNPRSTLCLPFS